MRRRIALAPLSDSETAALVSELLGSDPSVGEVGTMIAERAAGNPFFAEEIVRDLAERGVLRGNRSAYASTADVAEVSVPATLQATIAARIDRLDPSAKRTLSAAAVIGSRFSRDLLETLGIDPVLEDLVSGEFIDQITIHRTTRVCVPPSAGPHGGLRIPTQIGSRRAAPAAWRRRSKHVTRQRPRRTRR